MNSNLKFRIGRRIARRLERPALRGRLSGRILDYLFRSVNNVGSQLEYCGELEIVRRLSSRVDEKWTVVDVGANVGQYAEAWLKSSPQIRVISLEIDTILHEILRKKVTGYEERWFLHEFGLSDTSGEVKFYSHAAGSEVNSIERVRDDIIAERSGLVVRASEFMPQIISDQTFLKLDVEGHEYPILFDLMRHSIVRPAVVQFEFGSPQVQSRRFLRDFYEVLPEYELGKVYQRGVDFLPYIDHMPEFFGMANFLAVHRSQQEVIGLLRYR